jgi:hypothetical protein
LCLPGVPSGTASVGQIVSGLRTFGLRGIVLLAALGLVSGSAPGKADTYFDLGIDVSWAGNTTESAHEFLMGLEPTMRNTNVKACAHFMDAQTTAQSYDTLRFCGLALAGTPYDSNSARGFAGTLKRYGRK